MKKDVDEKLDIYKLTTPEEILKYYQGWTKKDKYNQDMVHLNYVAPKETVLVLKKYALDSNCKILDAGCGTGLVGVELKKFGYSNIDGVDFSQNKGLICFTINEGIYEKYGFDKKIKELTNNKSWNVKEFFKSNYIVNKEVNAWLCLAEIVK